MLRRRRRWGSERPRPPWHGYLPFPGTPTKAATLMCTFRRWADRTHRSKEPVDSLSFLRAGRGACWGGRWRPQDKGGETTGRIPSLTCQYHRPLPPTPETCGLVSVLRVEEGPLSREAVTWRLSPAPVASLRPPVGAHGPGQDQARCHGLAHRIRAAGRPRCAFLLSSPSHQQLYPLKVRGPKQRGRSFP